ncbi:hypothetical protein [Streptomyces venezuelae]|uniref:hypothetical protein n=1 Tax=Bacillus paramycoides TaxID=2026194 RepID=UPI0034467C66
MKISEIYKLNVDQKDLEFIDVDVERDVELFIDPCWIHILDGKWFKEASVTIFSFFEHIIDLYENDRKDEAKQLFHSAHEPNETCLGMSKGTPDGTGASSEMLASVFEVIINEQMIEKGLIRQIEDIPVFIENFNKDRLSDLVTNLIRKHLVEFTKEQCKKHNMPLTPGVTIGFYWNKDLKEWDEVTDEALIIDGKIKLLVPKILVVKNYRNSAQHYCRRYVLIKRREEHIRENSSLVKTETLKSGKTKVTVVLDDIETEERKKLGKTQKEYVREITEEDPDLMERFRREMKHTLLSSNTTNRLTDEQIMEEVNKVQQR